MNLALFDLDHTLIPFDSGMAWTQFLVAQGALPPEAEARYLAFCHQYVAGTLDIHAMHHANVAPLRRFTRAELAGWGQVFEGRMADRIPASMRGLVTRHQRAGDLCAIVTATTRFIAQPFGRLFGMADVLATEPATEGDQPDAPFTGAIAGEPCFREHKLTHVTRWLARRGTTLGDFDKSWFYSDSASDLPLLEAVSHPVAVDPDERLRAHAQAFSWRILQRGD